MVQLINDDCVNALDKLIALNINVDMVLTSPPYDTIKNYHNTLEWDENIWQNIIRKLYKILKKGGVVIWVVSDGIYKGSETGTSFKQALYFKSVGFNIHDTMIYNKTGFSHPGNTRYHQTFEYMYVFSKGSPKTFNPLNDRKNKYVGVLGGERSRREKYGKRYNVWTYANGGGHTSKNKDVFKHPAPFPEKLAEDHIKSWSNEGDLILDPMCGASTTGYAATKLKRDYIGIDKVKDYIDISKKRLEEVTNDRIILRRL